MLPSYEVNNHYRPFQVVEVETKDYPNGVPVVIWEVHVDALAGSYGTQTVAAYKGYHVFEDVIEEFGDDDIVRLLS